MLPRPFLESYKIKGYWRFKDDIILLATCRPSAHEWFDLAKARASFFTLECVQFGKSVDILDLTMSVQAGRFRTCPRYKTSELDVPCLHDSSCHAPGVHVAWPCNMLSRKFALCMSKQDTEMARDYVVAKFRRSGMLNSTIASLQALECNGSAPGERPEPLECMWLILGYHPSLHRAGIHKSLRKFIKSHVFNSLWNIASPSRCIRLGWKNVLPNLASRLTAMVKAGVGG